MIFSTPSPCGHSPYLICDEQRERIESITLNRFIPSELCGGYSPPPLPCPVAWRGVLYKIGARAKEEYISTSPPVFRKGI